MPDTQTAELTALHAMSTLDLIDILINEGFSAEEKATAAAIVKDRVSTLQTKFSNLQRLVGRAS